MSAENVMVVRELYEAYQRQGFAAYADSGSLDPEVEFHTDPSVPEPGVYRGREAVIAYLKQWDDAFRAVKSDLDEVIDLGGDEVLVILKLHGQLQEQGGAGTELVWYVLNTIRAGKLVRVRSFFDKDRAFDAAGLSGSDTSV
jgi:ketosteroid isomerase-like protein